MLERKLILFSFPKRKWPYESKKEPERSLVAHYLSFPYKTKGHIAVNIFLTNYLSTDVLLMLQTGAT